MQVSNKKNVHFDLRTLSMKKINKIIGMVVLKLQAEGHNVTLKKKKI